MKLLICSSEFPPGPGGIGTHAYQLAGQFSQKQIEIAVVTAQDYSSPHEVAAFNQAQPFPIVTAPHHPMLPFQALLKFRHLRRMISAFKPDRILASGQRAVWNTAACLRNRGIPWTAVGHGSEFGSSSKVIRAVNRWAYQSAHQVICVSQFTRRVMEQSGIRSRNVRVITNGADDGFFCACEQDGISFRERFGWKDSFLILTVGNVTPRKGQEVVIRALPQIRQSIPNVRYLMAGLPTDKERLAALADQLGVLDCVTFLGRIPAHVLRQAYRACDVFAMTSRYTPDGDFEGYGIAVTEAALCGKPAVVSGGSGLQEAVQHRETGLVVAQNDPDDTAKAIIYLAKNPAVCKEMGNRALQRAANTGTWQSVAGSYAAAMGFAPCAC